VAAKTGGIIGGEIIIGGVTAMAAAKKWRRQAKYRRNEAK
jgi:hypothetical protein